MSLFEEIVKMKAFVRSCLDKLGNLHITIERTLTLLYSININFFSFFGVCFVSTLGLNM